jgi:hypothetical protein
MFSFLFLNSSRSPSPYQRRPSPLSSTSVRRRTKDGRPESAKPSSILGVFGLPPKTSERALKGNSQLFCC